MTSSTVVCIDSSIVLNLWLAQPLTEQARALWQSWVARDIRLVAPTLIRYEATSVFRKAVHFGLLPAEKGAQGLAEMLSLPIEYVTTPDLHTRAFQLATQFKRPAAYDSHYLVVAESLGCEFWTADRRLVNAVSHDLPWVKWLGHYPPPESEATS